MKETYIPQDPLLGGEEEHTLIRQSEKKNSFLPLLFYFSLLLLFVLFLWYTATYLVPRFNPSDLQVDKTKISSFGAFKLSVEGHIGSTVGRLLLQVITILVVSRFVGWLFSKVKQPTVIGEIVAGILLGPSLLGALCPGVFEAIFPE